MATVVTSRTSDGSLIRATAWRLTEGLYQGHASCTRPDDIFVPEELVTRTSFVAALDAAQAAVEASLARIETPQAHPGLEAPATGEER